jgi:hypothetical protein
MKPTLAQRVIASGLPEKVVTLGGGIALMAATAATLLPVLELRLAAIAAFVFYVVVAGLLGVLLAAFAAAFLLGPVYNARAAENGAPYQSGDWVMILAGPHRGRVARVYEVWESRQQVRVDLGDEARGKFEDLFNYVAVLRQPPAN